MTDFTKELRDAQKRLAVEARLDSPKGKFIWHGVPDPGNPYIPPFEVKVTAFVYDDGVDVFSKTGSWWLRADDVRINRLVPVDDAARAIMAVLTMMGQSR